MKKLIKGALFLALVGTVMVSCEKDENNFTNSDEITNSENATSKTKSVQNKSGFSAENSDNPWDSIGIYHNQKLDEWIATYTGDGATQPFANSHFVSEGLDDLSNINPSNSTVDSLIRQLESNLETILSSTLTIETALDSATESSRAAYFSGELATLFTEAERLTKNYEQHITDIKTLEAEIMANNAANEDLTESDEMILLMACSVGRHSSSYWNNVLQTTTPWDNFDWYQDFENEPSPGLSWYAKDLRAFAQAAMVNMVVGTATIVATGGVAAGPMLLGMGVAAGIGSAW